MPITDYALAGNDTLGIFTPDQLFSGEMDIVTKPVTILTGLVLEQFTVLGRVTASGKLAKHNPANSDGTQFAEAILMHAVNTTAATAAGVNGTSIPAAVPGVAGDLITEVYVGGSFNPDMLVWDASLTTPILRAAQFARTNINIQRPL